ncbi:probable G-protein coupled receptor Mth-like 8 [Ceratitis capitata]|uniref:Putative G-protein coupled receptor Mth-like 8 n=1 Tax=Ceratitis capitata TaxID=7213 RepID=W8C9C0_CERCA|nr:probable G-protein coupled receptor Mth-like 8 [Ceratitis capitata]
MSSLRAARPQGVQMCAPTLMKAIKSVRPRRSYCCWPLIAAYVIIICASCCCKTACASGSGVAEVKYPCAFIDTINVTGIAWAYEQPPSATSATVERYEDGEYNNNNRSATSTIDETTTSKNFENTSTASDAPAPITLSPTTTATPITPSINSNAALLQRLGITHIPQEWIAAYDFIIRDGVRIQVERHLRACICKLKPCIRFCCAAGHYYDTLQRTCVAIASVIDAIVTNTTQLEHEQHQSALYALTGMDHHEVAVRGGNGSTRLVRTADHFNVNIGVPCERMRYVQRDNQLVHWTLFENGTIAYRHHFFSNYYCYTPHQVDNVTWEWQPLACVPKKLPFVLDTKAWTYAICLILAVICMFIILFVYLFCTDLRNTFYGVAIKVYTLCIIIGYSLMAHLTLTDPAQFSQWSCINIPACVILYVVLSFYILSFISFNFYMHFHGIIMSRLMFWLIFFPIALLTVGWSIFAANNDYDGKPIFGGDTCWFDPRNWSIMVYYYAPIFIACVLCIFFYILTLIHISEKRDFNIRKATESLEENRFRSFWKFFTYTFVVFLVCVTSFAINYYREEWTHINYAVCLFIVFHGFSALYALIGQNHQVQNFLRRIEDDVSSDDDEMTESALPMSGF